MGSGVSGWIRVWVRGGDKEKWGEAGWACGRKGPACWAEAQWGAFSLSFVVLFSVFIVFFLSFVSFYLFSFLFYSI